MVVHVKPGSDVAEITRLWDLVARLRAENTHLTTAAEEMSNALEAMRDDDDLGSLRWLLRKAVRQRRELARLNRTVVSQRFVLRTMARRGWILTKSEYLAARAAERAELQQLIEEGWEPGPAAPEHPAQ